MREPFKLFPFPLKASLQSQIHRDRRLRGSFSRMGARWATVQIARVRRGWCLAYEGVPNTGPFDTKQQAITWFVRGGR